MSKVQYTPEEAAKILRHCASPSGNCITCPLYTPDDLAGNCLPTIYLAIAELLEALLEERRWIPVTERLPEPGKRVIVVRPGKDPEQGVYLGVNGWWKIYGANTKAVTHWLPMPTYTAPEAE